MDIDRDSFPVVPWIPVFGVNYFRLQSWSRDLDPGAALAAYRFRGVLVHDYDISLAARQIALPVFRFIYIRLHHAPARPTARVTSACP